MELFKVPDYDNPSMDYLWRLRIVQTPLCGVYLHKLCTPDPRDTLHNHPWSFLAIVLKGGYVEFVPGDSYATSRHIKHVNWKPLKKSYHWIAELDSSPTWTLVFVGRRKRVWGYLDRDGTWTAFNEHPFNDQYLTALKARQ